MPTQEYEYEIVVLDKTEDDPETVKLTTIEDRLNRLAKQGYRLVAVKPGVQGGGSYRYTLGIMERRFDPDAQEDGDDKSAQTADDDQPLHGRPAYEWDDWEKKTHSG